MIVRLWRLTYFLLLKFIYCLYVCVSIFPMTLNEKNKPVLCFYFFLVIIIWDKVKIVSKITILHHQSLFSYNKTQFF